MRGRSLLMNLHLLMHGRSLLMNLHPPMRIKSLWTANQIRLRRTPVRSAESGF